jgi:large subunit ribosomal protein L35
MARAKLKTHKGAAKRFRRTAGGKISRGRAFMRHNLTKKATKRKRQGDKSDQVSSADRARVRKMLPYG